MSFKSVTRCKRGVVSIQRNVKRCKDRDIRLIPTRLVRSQVKFEDHPQADSIFQSLYSPDNPAFVHRNERLQMDVLLWYSHSYLPIGVPKSERLGPSDPNQRPSCDYCKT